MVTREDCTRGISLKYIISFTFLFICKYIHFLICYFMALTFFSSISLFLFPPEVGNNIRKQLVLLLGFLQSYKRALSHGCQS